VQPGDPGPLPVLGRVGPVQRVQARQQTICVCRDAQEPLSHGPLLHRRRAALAPALDGGCRASPSAGPVLPLDLLAGQHRPARRAPRHGRLGTVGQAGLEQPQEQPLGPPVVAGVAGRQLGRPAPGDAQALQLAAVGGGRVGHQLGGVGADPEGVVLSVDAEGVEADGLEHHPTLLPLVSGPDVGPAVRQRVPDVQPLGGGIRELDQVVQLVVGIGACQVDLAAAVVSPPALPAPLYLAVVVRARHRSGPRSLAMRLTRMPMTVPMPGSAANR
jgi:hypothetical protein